MKKFSVFICLLFVTICSFAQLNVIAEKIDMISTSYSLYKTQSGYEFVAETDNRYDSLFYFFLGENVVDAIQTTTDLLKLVENKEFEHVIVTNKDKKCHIYKRKMVVTHAFRTQCCDGCLTWKHDTIGKPWLEFKGYDYKGKFFVSKNELKKIIKKLSAQQTTN